MCSVPRLSHETTSSPLSSASYTAARSAPSTAPAARARTDAKSCACTASRWRTICAGVRRFGLCSSCAAAARASRLAREHLSHPPQVLELASRADLALQHRSLRGSSQPAVTSTQSSKRHLSVMSADSTRPWHGGRVAVVDPDVPRLHVREVPLDRPRCRRSARSCRAVRADVVEVDLQQLGVARRAARTSRRAGCRASSPPPAPRARRGGMSVRIGTPSSSSSGMPAVRSFWSSEVIPSSKMSSISLPKHVDVALVPVRRDEDADRVGHDLAQQLGHRVLALRVLLLEVVRASSRRSRCGAARPSRCCACPRRSRAGSCAVPGTPR